MNKLEAARRFKYFKSLQEQITKSELLLVAELREAGWAWEDISEVHPGFTTRQGVRRKFANLLEEEKKVRVK